MRLLICLAAVLAVALGACARSSVLPVAADTVQITTAAAPACGPTGAQTVAVRRASIETINRGFDRFVILGAGAQNDVRVVGHTPVMAHTTGNATGTRFGNTVNVSGTSTTTYSGGMPIVAGTHNQTLLIKMFREGDPAGANAVSARETLGPTWPELIKQSAATTC
jgi:hypothetical protein